MTYNAETAEILRDQAERCRRLAKDITDFDAIRRLLALAREFEERAEPAEQPGADR
jgi:hypothetical protein